MKRCTSLADLQNIHEGQKCFVVGAGPSLAFQEIDAIHDYVVIGVNSSAMLMPWEEPGDPLRRFWISTDILCMQWDYFWKKVMRFECTRIVRNSWMRESAKFTGAPMRYFTPRGRQVLKPKDGELYGSSSIMGALDLAIQLGCKNICLLGADHKMHHARSHFWQFWSRADRPVREGKPRDFLPCQRQQKRVFESNHRAFDTVKKFAEKQDATIYNCSQWSSIKNFKKISLDEALKL